MGEDWLTQVLGSRWFPAAITFFVGLATGVLIWSAGGMKAGDTEPSDEDRLAALELDPPGGAPTATSGVPDEIKLSALERELKKARQMLDDDALENEAFAELLTGLDEAVKRANGRLKIILKSIKGANLKD